ncbi:Hydrolase, related to pectinesterase [Orpheovirus IHUMI-LCC2]|uniref:Hydrolase, related to pectinesterase n=1 Tax=Orpheovirus IHUMI-LCC2 TaxID=2023057 RepID=A0A2I2L5H5_9VIRU|nr:Hydrolase, related to pectinesterase [Orpheovirus IHUMI-LCC2]SNW62798.1 Hydrolase, related to pectinesterase [Orpheovirus IHUMI-LCC2]
MYNCNKNCNKYSRCPPIIITPPPVLAPTPPTPPPVIIPPTEPNGVNLFIVDPILAPTANNLGITSTIQLAVNRAQAAIDAGTTDAATIYLTPRTYEEDVVIARRGITLEGMGLFKNVLILGNPATINPVININASGPDSGVFNNNIGIKNILISASNGKIGLSNTSSIPVSVWISDSQIISESDNSQILTSFVPVGAPANFYINNSRLQSSSPVSPIGDLIVITNGLLSITNGSLVGVNNESYAGTAFTLNILDGATLAVDNSTIFGRISLLTGSSNINHSILDSGITVRFQGNAIVMNISNATSSLTIINTFVLFVSPGGAIEAVTNLSTSTLFYRNVYLFNAAGGPPPVVSLSPNKLLIPVDL